MERRSVSVGAAVLALLAALVVVGMRWGERPDLTASSVEPGETHSIVVRTTLMGPQVYYFEGALVAVELKPDGDPDWFDALRSAPMSVGEEVIRLDVPSGEFGLVGQVVPCNGNCGELGPGIDACALPLEVNRDLEIEVRFRWGSACEMIVHSS